MVTTYTGENCLGRNQTYSLLGTRQVELTKLSFHFSYWITFTLASQAHVLRASPDCVANKRNVCE